MSSSRESMKPGKFDISILENLFLKPELADPDQQRTALIIHSLSTMVLLIAVSVLLLSPFLFDGIILGLVLTGCFAAVMVIVQVLNRKGKINTAAHLFVYYIWITDTVIILLSDGVHSDYLPAYIAISVMGGLILGGSSALHFTGLSLIAYSIFYVLDAQGIMLEPLIVFNYLSLFVIFAANLFMSALVLILVIRKYEDTYLQFIENEQSLQRTNLELQWQVEAREQAEVYYKQSEERFKSALMESPYPSLLHTNDGEILFINTAWVENSGYQIDEFEDINELNNQVFRNSSYQVSVELNRISEGEVYQNEGSFQVYTKQGEVKNWYIRWVLLPDLPDERSVIMAVALDMTNLIDVESALRKSEEDLSKLSLVTNDGIWDWDLTSDKVVFDPRYYTMAGYEVDEFPYHLDEFKKRVHPDDIEIVMEQAENHLSGDLDSFNVEFRFLRKDGAWLWIQGRGKIVEQDADGNPLRFVGTHRDISDRKQVEEDLNQYRKDLEKLVEDRTKNLEDRIAEVEKLNAALSNILDDYQIANEKLSRVSSYLKETNRELESFTYIVSNDLRDPLHNIKDISEELAQGLSGKKDQRIIQSLKQINLKADQMERLVTDLLHLSEVSQKNQQFQEINPIVLVNDILEEFDKEIKERSITFRISDLPSCLGDPTTLKDVFRHLISNAIKFTIETKDPEIVIGYQPGEADQRVIYFVQDNGVGFSMKDHEKVFETFQRLHDVDVFRGAGIGLALVKKIINQHGGDIWAEAKKKKGASFFFDLKLAN